LGQGSKHSCDHWSYSLGLAATGEVQWETLVGGGGDDLLRKVIRADDAWVAVGTDADVITGAASVLVVALDDSGTVLWKKKHGTSSTSNVGFYVIKLSTGGFAIAGLTRTGSAPNDGLILLPNADGSLHKSTQSGGLGGDLFRAVTELPESGIVVAGGIWAVDDVDRDAWLMSIDGDGNIGWEVTLGGLQHEDLRGLTALPGGGILASANTNSKGAGASDAWIVSLDSSGVMLGEILVGGDGHDVAHTIDIAPGGDALVVGCTGSDVDTAFNQWFLRVPFASCTAD
jgi:hypothetical protein